MTQRKTRKVSPRRTRSGSSILVEVSGCEAGLRRLIRRAARAALSAEGVGAGRLDVAVVDHREMRRLHGRWMGETTATDVLTFDLKSRNVEKSKRRNVDGQIVVCESVARRRAREDRRDWRDELLLYVVHGCLHLCGYDDRRARDAARMHRREDEILTRMGRGPVFYSSRSDR